MKTLASFYPRITPFVAGAPTPLIDQALVDSAIAFCDESLALREIQTSTYTVATIPAYTLAVPTDQEISRILNVWLDGNLIFPIPTDNVDYGSTLTSKPVGYYTTRANSVLKLNLYPIPDASYTLQAEVVYRPVRAAATLQDDLFNVWVEGVTNGAIGRILAVTGQVFSDPAGSMQKLTLAQGAARKARIDGVVGRVQSPRNIKFRPFA